MTALLDSVSSTTGKLDAVDTTLRDAAVWPLTGREIAELPTGADLFLVTRARVERLTGPVLAAADAGALELSDEAFDTLTDAHESALAWCLQLEARLLDLSDALDRQGIRYLVVKGSASAHLDEADPSVRTFADIDLLVPAADIDRAVTLLERQGAGRRHPEVRPGFDRRFAKSVTMTFPDGIQVDLHRTLVEGVFGARLPLERLFRDGDMLVLGGRRLPCLPIGPRMLHACYHAVLGSPEPRLTNLRDVAVHLAKGRVPPDAAEAEVREWGGLELLVTAVRETLAGLPLVAPAWTEWASTRPRSVSEQRLIERQRAEGSALGRSRLDVLRLLPPRQAAAFASALLFPTRAHLRSRGRSRTELARLALARVRPHAALAHRPGPSR